MFLIPGWLVSILTFPGVIVHEAAHKFFCDRAKVPVWQVCYFRFGNPAGYVIHAKTDQLRANFLISIGPLIVNTLLCALICFSPFVVFELKSADEPAIFWLLAWLGVSIGMHAFPSGQDMDNFAASVESSGREGLIPALAGVGVVIIKLANVARVAWFDALYALGVGWALPFLLLRL